MGVQTDSQLVSTLIDRMGMALGIQLSDGKNRFQLKLLNWNRNCCSLLELELYEIAPQWVTLDVNSGLEMLQDIEDMFY